MQWFAVSLAYWLASSNFVSITFIRPSFGFCSIVPDKRNIMIKQSQCLVQEKQWKLGSFSFVSFLEITVGS